MVLQFKTTTFNKTTGTGNKVVAGVGFTPKVVILTCDFATNAQVNTFVGDSMLMVGFAVDTTAANQRSTNVWSGDGLGTSDIDAAFHASSCFSVNDDTGFYMTGTLTVLDIDGFTLNFTANPSANLAGYIAMGGDDITNTHTDHFSTPSITGDFDVTGVGFKPDFVMLAGSNQTADNAFASKGGMCFGAFNSDGQQAFMAHVEEDSAATSDTARYQRTDKCLAMFSETDTATLTHEATFVSMDNDGFTINFSTASVANKRISYLAIKGIQTKIGSFTSPTVGTAPVSQEVTGVGFTPRGLIFMTDGNTATTSIAAHARWCVGSANSSTDEQSNWGGDEDNNATATVCAQRHDNNACIRVSDEAGSAGSTTTQALADFTSLDENGFTLNWSVKDASNAYQVIYVAFGDTPAAVVSEDRSRQSASLVPSTLASRRAKKRYSSSSFN